MLNVALPPPTASLGAFNYLLEDLDISARTAYGEARGDLDSIIGVVWVIRNRAEHPTWWGKTPAEVARKPAQFSCWNLNDPNRLVLQKALQGGPLFDYAWAITSLVFLNAIPDPTGGATNYHVAAMKNPPAWAAKLVPTVRLGAHQFYKVGR